MGHWHANAPLSYVAETFKSLVCLLSLSLWIRKW